MSYKIITSVLFSVAVTFIISCGGSDSNAAAADSKKTESPASDIKPVVNISTLIGKTLAESESVLGKADNVEKVSPGKTPCKENPCDKASFQSGKYEIVFIDGKADWITINQVSAYDLNNDAIALLGLPKSDPATSNTTMLRWENVEGIKEIRFFNNGSNKIDYIYVMANTK